MVTTVTMTRDPGTYSTETPPLPTKAKFAISLLSYHQNYHLSKFWQYWYIFCQYWFWYDDRVARRRSVKTSYSVKSYRWCQFLQFSFQHSQTKPYLRGKNKQRLHKIRYFSSFPTSMISQRDRREFGRNIFKTFLGSPTSCGFRSNPPKTCLASYPKTSPKTRMKTERGRKVGRKKAFYGLAPTAALIGRTRNAERPLANGIIIVNNQIPSRGGWNWDWFQNWDLPVLTFQQKRDKKQSLKKMQPSILLYVSFSCNILSEIFCCESKFRFNIE